MRLLGVFEVSQENHAWPASSKISRTTALIAALRPAGFYRTNGALSQNDGKHAPATLIRELGERARVGADGAISYQAFFPTTHLLAIASSAAVIQPDGCELGEADTEKILHNAINRAIRSANGKAVTPADVIREGNRLAGDHFRLPVKDFVLVTSMSVDRFPVRSAIINECRVGPVNRRSSKFVYSGSSKLGHVTAYNNHVQNTRYQLIRINTRGRCFHEAIDKALDSAHLLRGLWTLFATYGQSSIHFGIRRNIPLGAIHLGPIHILRLPDGNLASDAVWYDPDYVEDHKLFKPRNGWEKIEKNRKWALHRLKRLKYRIELERLIIRYVTALDNVNPDVAFLHLWAILEKLTGTIGKDYDTTIDRATRPFIDRSVCVEQLRALRLRRNQMVHAVAKSENRDGVVYIIKSFVEPHLAALLRNDFRVKSLDEFVEYLALPTDKSTLKKRQQQYSRMLRMS